MTQLQADLFAEAHADGNRLSDAERLTVRARLEATLARLEAAMTFPWTDPLDAVHEENRFERGAEILGEEGSLLWARFDKAMDRLHAARS